MLKQKMCYTAKLVCLKIYIYKKNIATQELEKEVPLALSEEKLNQNHSISTQLQVTCISTSSPTSPSIPSCWWTASGSAQTRTVHAALGHEEDTLWRQHTFPRSISIVGPAQTSLECTMFCRAFPFPFPCYCKRKQHCCRFSHQITFIPATTSWI